jgi:type I restriction enzyme S subunit
VKLQAYPRYKPSGVEWLGDVPEHWKIKRLDFLATVKARLGWKGLTADEYVPEGFIFLSTPNIKGEGEIDFRNVNYITAERYQESPEIMVRVGDVLMAKDGSTLGTTNVVRHLPAPTTVNSSIAVLRPKSEMQSGFFFRWLTGGYTQSVIQSMKDGQGVPHLFQADIKKFPTLLPPPAEQQAIAAFLDRETGRMDGLLGKRRELIERLKEKRTALISRAVTRGLPPDAARAAGLPANPALKPSGLDWLGETPEHWEVKQLKWAIMFQRGHDLPSDEREDGNVPLVSSAGISAFVSRAAARGPGIVTGRYGTIGDFYLIETDYWPLNTTLYSIELRGNHPPFLRYMLMHLSPLFLVNAVKSAVPGVDRNDIHSSHTAVPPLAEQIAIAAYLDAETTKLDTLAAKIDEAIDRLQEYRAALITAAVTGKIDVRKAAA